MLVQHFTPNRLVHALRSSDRISAQISALISAQAIASRATQCQTRAVHTLLQSCTCATHKSALQLSKIMKAMIKSVPVASARRPFAAGNKGSYVRLRCPWKTVTGRKVNSSHAVVRAAAGKCTCSQSHQLRSHVATYLLLLLPHSVVG